MYKLIIIDDEKEQVEGIRSVINWQKYDIEICGVAYDGKSGLNAIKELSPDVAIIDIRMPSINGLELIERINDLDDNIQTIILSGYDDFYYAQKAIELKAFDYLLKPCKPEEILEVVLEAIRNLYPIEIEKNILSCLKKANRDGVKKNIQKFYVHIQQNKPVSKADLQKQSMTLLSSTYNFCQENDISMGKPDDIYITFEQIISYKTVKQLQNNVLSFMLGIINKNTQHNINDFVVYALQYIDKHYTENIKLQDIADKIHISPGYLSLLFKQEMDMNFVEYLNKYRVKKAKELLHNICYKNYEVAYKVGYQDEKYFYQVFKRYTGLTPSQYRDKI